MPVMLPVKLRVRKTRRKLEPNLLSIEQQLERRAKTRAREKEPRVAKETRVQRVVRVQKVQNEAVRTAWATSCFTQWCP